MLDRYTILPPSCFHPVTGEALDLAPGTTADDLLPMPPGQEPTTAVAAKAAILTAALESHHGGGQHPDDEHPYCPNCRPGALSSLHRKLSLDFWFDPTGWDVGLDTPGWRFADGTTSGDEAEEPVLRFLTLEGLRALPTPEMLIDGVLPAGSLGYLIGRDGTWKTFLALDWACSLLCNDEWRGQDIDAPDASVLFLAGEGAQGIPERVDAWASHNGASGVDGLTVVPSVPNLYAPGPQWNALLGWVEENTPSLVVVDTLRRASGAGDQNSARDMGMVTDRLHALKVASGGTVLVLAHTDKADNDARGSSSIEDDADFVVHVRRKDEPLRQEMSITKMKDGPDDFTVTSYPMAVEGSLVLSDDDGGYEVAWSSTSTRSRVEAALRDLQPQGWATQSEIRNVTVSIDPDGKGVDSGNVSRQINALIREELVEMNPKAKAYRIVAT